MFSLTYLSTATESFTTPGLVDLLRSSNEANHGAGVTGMLLYLDGHFIQTLEGSEEIVDATFARIERDRRHRDVFIALREEVESRTFPDWSMGFETLSHEEASRLPGFNDYLETKTMPREAGRDLGRPGIFHRIFSERMR